MKFNIEVTCESKHFGLTEGGDQGCKLNDSDGVKDPDDLVTRRWLLHVCNIRQM